MIRIGLVEDDAAVRENLARLLDADAGCTCVAACASAEEAVRVLAAARPEVVLMDIHLPGRSGIECLTDLRVLLPGVQVIMLTVETDGQRVFESLKAGATGYVIKRAPIEELFDAIDQVHAGGSPMSATIARKVVGSFQVRTEVNGEKLSEREMQVLDLLSEGLRMKEIADRLNLSTNTVRTHVRHIYEKLQVQSRTEALNKARWPRGSA